MSDLEQSTFERCALAGGLLTAAQLDEARSSLQQALQGQSGADAPWSEQQLADRLVEMGRLNAWQAKQLLEGRTKFNLGPYVMVDWLGKGGTGQVFKGRHEKFGRIVAVKVLPHDKSTPEAVANFTHEIRAMAALNHPRLAAALDAGQDGSVYYLVTEFVPGMNLRQLVREKGPLGMAAAASIICQVAEGLEYAHTKGVIHRDVKPGNVMVTPDGEAKLLDLGYAGPLTGTLEMDPRYGQIVGTVDYLSPDQIRDPRNPTPGWDIYSLGCTLYYAVTGRVPFHGGNLGDKAFAHVNLRPFPPRRLNPQLSEEFVTVLDDMMAKDPTKRIASAREVIARLTPFLPGGQPAAPVADEPTTTTLKTEIIKAIPNEVRIVFWVMTTFVVGALLLVGAAKLLKWLAQLVW